MDLSVIIVNYNVKFFLEQCLCSVSKAVDSLNAEVIVVDNHSTDGSHTYLQDRFPFVRFIINNGNLGFSKANNQGIQQAKGKYILFLNPDTIVPEDCFSRCIAFMQSGSEAGALGLRMIDGTGKYLKESKRGFPTAWVSFCKMSGLTSLFPKSRIFARYYLGHLSDEQNQQVNALSGAFMLVKKEVLDKTGGFDERFFMYAEDIDLSYRIQNAGYKNYYFAESTIIHFKGESTIKDPRYIHLFYTAMSQFVQKHYRGFFSWLMVGILGMVTWIKSTIAKLSQKNGRCVKKPSPEKYTLIGDDESILELSRTLHISPQADSVIYCIGNKFSYKQMIEEIDRNSGNERMFIHGKSSGSIVGSGSKNERGITIAVSV